MEASPLSRDLFHTQNDVSKEVIIMNQHEKLGPSFENLSQEEMDFVTGAKGEYMPNTTPAITTSSAVCASISKVVSGGAVSWVVSFTASAWTKCRD